MKCLQLIYVSIFLIVHILVPQQITSSKYFSSSIPREIQAYIVNTDHPENQYSLIQYIPYQHNPQTTDFVCFFNNLVSYPLVYNAQQSVRFAATLNMLDIVDEQKKRIKKNVRNAQKACYSVYCFCEQSEQPPHILHFYNDKKKVRNDIHIKLRTPAITEGNTVIFDGPNINNVMLLAVNTRIYSRLYAFDAYNNTSNTETSERFCRDKYISLLRGGSTERVTALMLHNYENKVAMCTHNMRTHNKIFSVGRLSEKKYPSHTEFLLQATNKVVINHDLLSIFRLTDTLYLALASNNRLQVFAIDSNNAITVQEKNVMYQSNQDDALYEDLFIHLAVDNQIDRYQESVPRGDATSFVVVNTQRRIFWGSFKSLFYNQKGKITLRQLNNISHLDGNTVKKLWLNSATIGMLCDDGTGARYIQTVDVSCFKNHLSSLKKE